jgi:hypothetical protein
MKKSSVIFCLLILIFSCSRFVGLTDREAFQEKVVTESGKSTATIHFSHNINGELYPCGCRHFPLGGLPQIAGAISKSHKSSYVIYVDTGDTLFPSTVIPDALKGSLLYNANNLVEAMSKLGLKFYVPGDQDFAQGEDFLADISQKATFTFLVSNFSAATKIKHKKWAQVSLPNLNLYFIGITDPSIYPNEYQALFTSPEEAIEKALDEIPNDDNQKIILLSHSGIDKDIEWSKKFPRINWIVGAHTQNFLREPILEGTTKIAQTLSKNHYLGSIKLDLGNGEESYELVEIRDELKEELKPNLFSEFLDKHKAGLREVQAKEQSLLTSSDQNQRIVTANNCIQCHKSQFNFWQQTSHSLAFGTLLKNHEEKNTQCVGCHSLKFSDPRGYSKFAEIIATKDNKTETQTQEYWKKYLSHFQNIKSVRLLSSKEKLKISQSLVKLDQTHKVTHNFAGVQCLNCHSKSNNHPFDAELKISNQDRFFDIKNQCLNCHTTDQSPEWYENNKLKENDFKKKYKTMSCPQRKEYE